MKTERQLIIAWLLMTVAAVTLIVASINTAPMFTAAGYASPRADAPEAVTIVVMVPSATPKPTETPNLTPSATPWPTGSPSAKCPQVSGRCEWYWPTITPSRPKTPTPFPICSTPVMGQRCEWPTPTGGS